MLRNFLVVKRLVSSEEGLSSMRGPLEKLTVAQLLKDFPTIYGTGMFLAVFTRSFH
jgi:hypothetical protein